MFNLIGSSVHTAQRIFPITAAYNHSVFYAPVRGKLGTQMYALIGFLERENGESHSKVIAPLGLAEPEFYLRGQEGARGERVSYEDICTYLEHEAAIGRKMVGRLLVEGNLASKFSTGCIFVSNTITSISPPRTASFSRPSTPLARAPLPGSHFTLPPRRIGTTIVV